MANESKNHRQLAIKFATSLRERVADDLRNARKYGQNEVAEILAAELEEIDTFLKDEGVTTEPKEDNEA